MMQLKLFEIIGNDNTLGELKSIFGQKYLIPFSNRIIGITYDYGENSYIEILKKIKVVKVRQVIVTSSTFLRLIDFCVKKELYINNIKFVYPIAPESVKYVDEHIEKINATTGTDKVKHKAQLYKEIDWITSDECIDIKSISIDMQNSETSIFYAVELYNNGVLLINDKSITSDVNDLILNVLE